MAESKDSSSELETLEKLVTCEICNDILKEPKGLPCLHTFCFKCIQSWFQTCQRERKPFSCPSCRAATRAPQGNVAKLPTSFQTNSLIQVYKRSLLKKKQQDFKDAKLQVTNQNDVLKDMLQMCMITQDLADENMRKTDQEIDSAKEKVSRDAAIQIKMIKDDERAKHEQLEANRAKYKESHETSKNEISECIQRTLALSNQCKQATDMDIDHFNKTDLQQLLNDCQTTMSTILADSQSQASKAAQQTEPIANQQITKHSNCLKIPAIDKNTAECKGQMQLKVMEHSKASITMQCAGGRQLRPIKAFPTARISGPVSFALNGRGEIAIIGTNGFKPCFMLYSADGIYIRQIGHGGKGSGEGLLGDPNGIAFISEDKLLVSDNIDDDASLKEYHFDGRFLRTVRKQNGMWYRRMCTSGQRIACLCYNEKSKETSIMLVCKQTGTYLHDIKLIAPNVKSKPLYLTYDSNKYFVTFVGLHSIYVFAEIGALLYIFGEEGDQPGLFVQPHGLAVFGENMLLVCDASNNRVQLLDQGGRYIQSYGGRGSRVGEMNRPMDVFVTEDGQVFVLEAGNRRFQVFTV